MLRRCFYKKQLRYPSSVYARNFVTTSLKYNSNKKESSQELHDLFQNYLKDLNTKKEIIDDTNNENIELDHEEAFDIDQSYDEEQFFLSKDEENFLLKDKKFDQDNNIPEEKLNDENNLVKTDFKDIEVEGVGNIFDFLKERGDRDKAERDAMYLQKQRLAELAKKKGVKTKRFKRNELYSLNSLEDRGYKLNNDNTNIQKNVNSDINTVKVANLLEKELTNKEHVLSEEEIISSLDPSAYEYNELFQQNKKLYEPLMSKIISAKLSTFSKKALVNCFSKKGRVNKSLKKSEYIDAVMSKIWNMHTSELNKESSDSLVTTKFQIKTEYLKLAKSEPMIDSKVFKNLAKPRYAVAVKTVLANPEFSDVIVIHSKTLSNQPEITKFKNFETFVNSETVNVNEIKTLLVSSIRVTSSLKNTIQKNDDDTIWDNFINYMKKQGNCILEIKSDNKVKLTFEGDGNFEKRIFAYIDSLVRDQEQLDDIISNDKITTLETPSGATSEVLLCDDGYLTERPKIMKNVSINPETTKISNAVLESLNIPKTKAEQPAIINETSVYCDIESTITQHNLIPGRLLEKQNEIKFETSTPYLDSKMSHLIMNQIEGFKKFQSLNCNLVPFIDREIIISKDKGERIDVKTLTLPLIEFLFDIKDPDNWTREFVEIDIDSLMIVGDLGKNTSYLKIPFKEYDFKYLKEKYLIFDNAQTLPFTDTTKKILDSLNIRMMFQQEKIKIESEHKSTTLELTLPVLLADGVTKDFITVKYKFKNFQLLTSNHYSVTYDDIAVFNDTNIITASDTYPNKKYLSVELNDNDHVANVVVLDRFNITM